MGGQIDPPGVTGSRNSPGGIGLKGVKGPYFGLKWSNLAKIECCHAEMTDFCENGEISLNFANFGNFRVEKLTFPLSEKNVLSKLDRL